MNCEGCYKNKHCWACVIWFGCSKTKEEKKMLAAKCFQCDKIDCPKNNTKGD